MLYSFINKFRKRIKRLSKQKGVNTLFLASDDYNAYNDIKTSVPNMELIRKSFPPEGLNGDWSYEAEDKEQQLYECLRDVYYILKSSYFIPSNKSSVSKSIIKMIQEKKNVNSKLHSAYRNSLCLNYSDNVMLDKMARWAGYLAN